MVVNCEASDHSWRPRLNIYNCENSGYLLFFSWVVIVLKSSQSQHEMKKKIKLN